jgi:hypothetical protein
LPAAVRSGRKSTRRFAHGRCATPRCFGGVQPLIKPYSESGPVRPRIGRVWSNLLDARLVQLMILASPRVVHPQASSPSFEGALRQSSPKVPRSACYPPCSSLLQHSSLRTGSKVILSSSIDEAREVLLSLLESHTSIFDFSTWSWDYYISFNISRGYPQS